MIWRCLIYLTILLLLASKIACSQKLYGFVFEQNSGNKPITGVMVKAILANQTLTTDNGSYTLTFQDGKPGHSAILVVEKEKWVITEKSRLEVNLPLDPFSHPHSIVMCRADIWVKQNQDNNILLNKILRETLQKQKAALNKQSVNYQKTIDSLEEQYVKTQRDLGEITKALSRINFDEISETEKVAYSYFKEGKLEEALLLRETLQSEKNLLIENQRLKDLQAQQLINDSALTSVFNTINLHRRNLREEITLAKLRFDWKTAERKLKFLAGNDSLNYDNLFDYGDFLLSQNDFDKALPVFDKLVSIYTDLSKANTGAFGPNLANALYKSGIIQQAKHQYNNAEALLQRSYNIYNSLFKTHIATFVQPLTQTAIAIADIHGRLRLFLKAEKEYQQALEVVNQIKISNPDIYSSLLAVVQNGQAQLFMYKNDFPSAEKSLMEVLSTRKKLDSINPLSQELEIAAIQTSLGIVYIQQKKIDAAKVLLERSLDLYKKFQQTSPKVFSPLAAEAGMHLGKVYMAKADLGTYVVNKIDSAAAHNYFSLSLQSFRNLLLKTPEVYESALANACYNMGVFFAEALESDSAEALFTQAIALYENLANEAPDAFDLQLAGVQQRLSKLYMLRNSESAKILLNKALTIYKRHAAAKENMDAQIADVQFDLAVTTYYSRVSYSKKESEQALKTCLQQFKYLQITYEDLDKKQPGVYTENLQSIKTFIASVNKEMERMQGVDSSAYSSVTESEKAANELNGLSYDIQSATTITNKLMLQQLLVTKKRAYIESGLFTDTISFGHDLNELSWYLLFNKQFKEAEYAAKEALNPPFKKPDNYDKEIEYANANLAHALLLQNKFEDAKKIYESLKNKSYLDGTSYVSMCLDDISQMEKAGITHKDFEKIKTFLVE